MQKACGGVASSVEGAAEAQVIVPVLLNRVKGATIEFEGEKGGNDLLTEGSLGHLGR